MSSRLLTLGDTVDRAELVRQLLVEQLDASYNLALLLVRDRDLAQEATHDAVVRAIGSSRTLRDPAAFEAWFRRILVNSTRDVIRRHRVRSTAIALPRPGVVPDPAGASIERDALDRALARLSDEHREVVVLRYYADLTVEAIAQALGTRTGTVKSRVHRALSQLRAEYEAASRTSDEESSR